MSFHRIFCLAGVNNEEKKVLCGANIPKTRLFLFLALSVSTESAQRTTSGKGRIPSLRTPIPLPQNLPTIMVGFARAAKQDAAWRLPFVIYEEFRAEQHT